MSVREIADIVKKAQTVNDNIEVEDTTDSTEDTTDSTEDTATEELDGESVIKFGSLPLTNKDIDNILDALCYYLTTIADNDKHAEVVNTYERIDDFVRTMRFKSTNN